MNTKSILKRAAAIAVVGIIGCATSLAAGSSKGFLESIIPPELDAAIEKEINLVHRLFDPTNNFDVEVCKAAKADSGKPTVVRYESASFVFYYSFTNLDLYSSTNLDIPASMEMSLPDEIICKGKEISRRASTREIPVNYIRLVDPSKKGISAEVDLILSVAPLESPEKRKSVRHSFRFTYRNGWKKD